MFQELINAALLNKRERDVIQPYSDEYYNVHAYFTSSTPQRYATGRIVNNLIETLNQKQVQRMRLPRFLIVMPDKDIINDTDDLEIGESETVKDIAQNVNWVARQIDIHVRRKCLQINERKPGAICSDDPVIIYVPMMPRTERYDENSRMGKICSFRAKYNEILNEAAN